MLPEPGQIGGTTVAGDADDLIAKLADAEIDKLMAADEDGAPAPTPPAPPSDPIADLDRSAAAADAVQAALDAALPAPAPPAEEPIQPIAAPSIDAPPSSDADAVAAELAADAQLHGRTAEPPPSPAPAAAPAAEHRTAAPPEPSSIPEVPASDPNDVKTSLLARVADLPWVVLDAINYPVRHLSEKARESLGVVAIVTIVNASGLIVYRLFVAKH